MNTHTTIEGTTGKCPFQRFNNRLQEIAKARVPKFIRDQQINKHRIYVNILKGPFQIMKEYYTNIQDHIKPEDVEHFQTIGDDRDERTTFLREKLKEYFWDGFSFRNDHSLTPPELSFKKIGDLGLEDVAMIVDEVLSQNTNSPFDDILLQISEEIDLRLKNNVLVDAMLHLPEFPYKLISINKETSVKILLLLISKSIIKKVNRFALTLIPEAFRGLMKQDGLIDEDGVIPQLTFGCPIININNGKVFKAFVMQFVRRFLTVNEEIESPPSSL